MGLEDVPGNGFRGTGTTQDAGRSVGGKLSRKTRLGLHGQSDDARLPRTVWPLSALFILASFGMGLSGHRDLAADTETAGSYVADLRER